jgi:hypothetical protein
MQAHLNSGKDLNALKKDDPSFSIATEELCAPSLFYFNAIEIILVNLFVKCAVFNLPFACSLKRHNFDQASWCKQLTSVLS